MAEGLHQPDRVHTRVIAAVLGVLLLVLAAAAGIAALMLGRYGADRPLASSNLPTPPPPQQRPDPATEREALLRQQRQRLDAYGWADQDGGFVHVPIDRAMELLLQAPRPSP